MLILAACVLNYYWIFWQPVVPGRFAIGVIRGSIAFHWASSQTWEGMVPVRTIIFKRPPGSKRGIDWRFSSWADSGGEFYFVPLSSLLALFVVATASLFYLDRSRPIPGHCRQCGYDLTANVSGVCPECGKRV